MTDLPDLAKLRTAVVGRLRDQIPNVSIETHGGAFTKNDLAVISQKTPAVRVSVTGFSKITRHTDGRWKLPVHVAAVAIAKDSVVDKVKIDRDETALLLANVVSLAVVGHRFGFSGVFQPENIEARNEYSEDFYSAGLALWQVTWTQDVLLGATLDEAIGALSQLFINQVLFADPSPVEGADPMTDPPSPGAP